MRGALLLIRNGKIKAGAWIIPCACLFAITAAENDYATQSMLKWFIDEQVEEEETAQNIIDNLKMIKDNGYGLYMLDKELGARVYTQAAPLAGK